MFELYSKRQTLSVILFHFGLVNYFIATGYLISWTLSGSKEHFQKLLLVFLSTAFGILVVEFGLRVDGRFETTLEKCSNGAYHSFLRQEQLDSWYRVRLADTTLQFPRKEFDFTRVTNSYGLSERPIRKTSTKFRIIGIGDSFTEGTGVSQDSTWLRRLESNLNADSTVQIETVNAGIGGSDPIYGYRFLQDKLLDLNPKVVILSVNSSDITDIAYRGGFERFYEDGTSGRKPPKWEWLYQLSHLVRLVAHNGLRLNHYLVSPEDELAGRKIAVQSLKQVATDLTMLGNDNGFEPLIVIHPILYDFNHSQYLDSELLEFKDYLIKNRLRFIDIRDCFRENGVNDFENASEYYWQLDRHFNQKGYDFYGDCVTDYLTSNGLIEGHSTN